MFVCPDMKDNHVLHFFSPFAWKVWVCLCLCVLTGHAVFLIDIARWLFLVPRETNICWKMSVNDQHFSENVCQWRTFLKNACEWPTFLEKCLSMTDISWKMSVDHHHFSSKLWWMTFIFPCTLSHLYECFLWKMSACVIPLVGLTRHSVSARLFSLPQLTNNSWKMSVNDQHVCSKCWWMMVICPEMKDKHVLHFFSPLCKFCLEVWVCLCLCAITGHAVFSIDITRGLFLVPRETNISWKMSANDQHFCSICLSMMFICPEMKDNHVLHFFSPLC